MAYQSIDDYNNVDLSNFTPSNSGNAAGANGIMDSFRKYLSSVGGQDSMFSGNSMFGGSQKNGTQSMGWAAPALGIGQAVMGGIMGNRQLGLAEDNFKEGKRQFNLNYGAQRQTTNTQLEDRQRARVASNPGAYESVDTYLDKNRIK